MVRKNRISVHLDVLDQISLSDYDAGTLVPAYQWELCRNWPISIHSMKICVTDAGVLDVNKNFVRAYEVVRLLAPESSSYCRLKPTWLLHIDLLELHWPTCLLNDLCHLLLRYVDCHCDCRISFVSVVRYAVPANTGSLKSMLIQGIYPLFIKWHIPSAPGAAAPTPDTWRKEGYSRSSRPAALPPSDPKLRIALLPLDGRKVHRSRPADAASKL